MPLRARDLHNARSERPHQLRDCSCPEAVVPGRVVGSGVTTASPKEELRHWLRNPLSGLSHEASSGMAGAPQIIWPSERGGGGAGTSESTSPSPNRHPPVAACTGAREGGRRAASATTLQLPRLHERPAPVGTSRCADNDEVSSLASSNLDPAGPRANTAQRDLRTYAGRVIAGVRAVERARLDLVTL
jgi:hypothetical protein